MYDIKDLDTEKLLFNPKSKEDLEKLRKDVPEFDVETELNKDNVARYVILMYDIGTPMRKEYPKFREREAISAQYAGFKIGKKGHFTKEVEGMLIGKNDEVNAMIVKYLTLFNNPDYTALMSYIKVFEENAKEGMRGTMDSTKYKSYHDTTEKYRVSIVYLTDKVFGGKADDDLIRELYRDIEKVKELLMPEFIAKKLADGEEYPYNPYGDYEPEELELINEEEIFKDEE